jgi:uncharacterized protein YegP (UPF0339 family)
MTAKFVLERANNGKYHFNLQAANGEIIATSGLHETKASAEKGIESMRMHAQRAELDDRSEQASPKPQPPRQHPPKQQSASGMHKPQAPKQQSDMKPKAHAKA